MEPTNPRNMKKLLQSMTPSEITELKQYINEVESSTFYETAVLPTMLMKKSTDGKVACPHCASTMTKKYGYDKHGNQRYGCMNEECTHKTFNVRTNTLLHSTKKGFDVWQQFVLSYLQSDTIDVCADKIGIHRTTALRWRHKMNYIFSQYMNKQTLKGTVHLDETLVNDTEKGKTSPTAQKKKKGVSNDKVNIACAVDENHNFILQATVNGRITSEALIDIFEGKIEKESIVISDSLRSYHKLMKTLSVNWIKIPSGKKEHEGSNLDPINYFHGAIKQFMNPYYGVSKRNLQGYLALFAMLRKNPRHYSTSVIEQLSTCLFTTPTTLRMKHLWNKVNIYELEPSSW